MRGGVLSAREVDEGRAAVMELSPLGRIVDECWREIPAHFPAIAIPSHVVMPNHMHGIVQITPTPEWTTKMRKLREQEIERSKNWPVGATHASPADGGAHRARHASPYAPTVLYRVLSAQLLVPSNPPLPNVRANLA